MPFQMLHVALRQRFAVVAATRLLLLAVLRGGYDLYIRYEYIDVNKKIYFLNKTFEVGEARERIRAIKKA